MKSVLRAVIVSVMGLAISSPARASSDFIITRHSLAVELEPQRHSLSAVDTMWLTTGDAAGPLRLFLNRNLAVEAVVLDGRKLDFSIESDYDPSPFASQMCEDTSLLLQNAHLLEVDAPGREGRIELTILYEGVIYDSLRSVLFSQSFIADQITGSIGEEGVFLSPQSYWYPNVPGCGLASFRVSVTTPESLEVVTQGRRVERRIVGGKRRTVWDAVYPSDGLHLVAGRYEIKERQHGGITITTFFYPESQDLSEKYVTFSAQYLDMYEDMLGRYPYAKFAVVENFFPSGYGMPSYTLLGSQVIRLPFIVHTSLGHEICHNWWGNSVFIDEKTGNWCEGLTTYCADYYYKELESPDEAAAYRLSINTNYTVYVTERNDFPLSEFEERTDPASRAIGYGKSAMVFHQVRGLIGDGPFFTALRSFYENMKFQRASWSDLRDAFEEASGQELGWFFGQWVDRCGAPLLTLSEVRLENGEGWFKVTATVEQHDSPFRIEIPIVLETSEDTLRQRVEMDTPRTMIDFEGTGTPLTIRVDPDYDVFRRLDHREIAPSISMVMGDADRMAVIPTGVSAHSQNVYRSLADGMNRSKEARIIDDGQATEGDVNEHSFFLLGGLGENEILRDVAHGLPEDLSLSEGAFTLFGKEYSGTGHCLVAVFRNPFHERKAICLVWGLSPEAVEAVEGKIVHYGKYGYLVFDTGENVVKGGWQVRDNPLVYRF